jgi:hypothetical protein
MDMPPLSRADMVTEPSFTADEVDLAMAALETGTLTEWSDRAAVGG